MGDILSNLHPVFQDAMRPFVKPAFEVHMPPPLSAREIRFEWNAGLKEPIVCHLDYEKSCKGAREDGLPMEPDYPSRCYLNAAYVRGLDVMDILSEDQVKMIEEQALMAWEGI